MVELAFAPRNDVINLILQAPDYLRARGDVCRMYIVISFRMQGILMSPDKKS